MIIACENIPHYFSHQNRRLLAEFLVFYLGGELHELVDNEQMGLNGNFFLNFATILDNWIANSFECQFGDIFLSAIDEKNTTGHQLFIQTG
jgi:hypothetical protein